MRYIPDRFKNTEVLEYLRKSRSDDPDLSVEEVLEKHEKILNDYAERNLGGIVLTENVYREIASSETIDGRPEMLRLLRAVESPRIKAVLVVEVQRLSRGDLEDAGRLIKLLRYTGTQVITPQKTYDLQDEYDRDAFERELKRGNEYLEYFKKIQARGRLASVQDGNFVGSIPPYGYDKIFVNDGKRKCPTLKINEEQAAVVRTIFDLYVNRDYGYKRICNYLDDMKIPPPKGDYWSAPALKDMLDNVHYIGKVKWNCRKTVTAVENQEVIRTRPKAAEYLIYEGKHEAIIAEDLFTAAKNKKGRNARVKTNFTVKNPFAGLLFCRCGRSISLKYFLRPDGSEKSAPRFVCEGQTHCNSGSLLYSELLERVCQIIKSCVAEFEISIQNAEKDAAAVHRQLIANLERKMKKLEQKELDQWELRSSGEMPKAVFEKLNQKLIKEKEDLRQALQKAYEAVPDPIDYQEKKAKLTDALDALNNPNVSPAAKNKYLKAVFERLECSRERQVRLRFSEAEADKITGYSNMARGWYSPPFELNATLRF
ncbi:MAG: recombinase family protein [Butyrivibrio sp.]|nr:recombinase family protein [Butyrivibrio sp.]